MINNNTLPWRVRTTPLLALRLLAELDQCYAPSFRPRIAGRIETDGQATLYVSQPHVDSALLLLLADYGPVRLSDGERGLIWIEDERTLTTVLAILSADEAA